MEDKKRVNYECSSSKMERIKELMKQCDISTQKELFENALTLLNWAIIEIDIYNRQIGSLDSDGNFHQLIMPVLTLR